MVSFCITEGKQSQHIFARDVGMAFNNLLYFGIHDTSLSLQLLKGSLSSSEGASEV